MRCYFYAVLAWLTCFIPAIAGDILNLGDTAPPLAVSSWVKGEATEKLEPGRTYVIEFWATWCGPCRDSIPHVTKLAHEYKDRVHFIGVVIWEQDTSKVQPFVEEIGDKMDYSVALDVVASGEKADNGVMSKTWMAAAAEFGIPTAFVVRDGVIAWIGHPLQLDEPLAKITAGTWDAKSLAAARLVERAKEKKVTDARTKIFKPYREHDYKTTLAVLEDVIAGDAELAEELGTLKFAVLNHLGDTDAAITLGTKLLDQYKDDAHRLNNIAWPVVDPQREFQANPKLVQLALRAAKRADELTKGENFSFLDTLACALYFSGDVAGAVAAEEKAIELLKQEVQEESHPYLAQFRGRLELFRGAPKASANRP